jgi:hypothetical protein
MYGTSLDEVHAVGSLVPQLNPPTVAVRGFGYQHDGATGTIEQFLTAFVFVQTTVTVNFDGIPNIPPNPYGIPFFANPADPLDPSGGLSLEGLELRRAIASFVLAYDSNLFPIVGQQPTLTKENAAASAARLALLEAQATAGQSDLVAHGRLLGRDMGLVFSNGTFVPDDSLGAPITTAELVALVSVDPRDALTFTAVPPGEGWRLGNDRDGDGYADGDEIARGSDPADPASVP